MARGLQESQQNPEITVNELMMGYQELDVAGGDDYTVSDDEFNHAIFDCTGVLTDNIDVIMPDDSRVYYVYNNTTGSYTLTVRTTTGTGDTVTQGSTAILVSDGSDITKFVG